MFDPSENIRSYINGVQVTEDNIGKVLTALEWWYENRRLELEQEISRHKPEIDNMPEILGARICALHEVNLQKFANAPDLILSSLAATKLTKTIPNKAKVISQTYYKETLARYGLYIGDDVRPDQVSNLFWAYRDDVKHGAITEDGKIINIAKSKVMTVCHEDAKYGLPCDARGLMSKYMYYYKTDHKIRYFFYKIFCKNQFSR
jgi:hypothetical protein